MKASLVITLSLLACLLTSPAEATGQRQSDKPTHVTVTEDWRACNADSDCVQVGLGCNGCCDYDAVAKDKEPVFNETFKSLCADYKGGVCECHDPDRKQPACVNNRCAMVKPKLQETP